MLLRGGNWKIGGSVILSEDVMGLWPTTVHEKSLDSRPRFRGGDNLARE